MISQRAVPAIVVLVAASSVLAARSPAKGRHFWPGKERWRRAAVVALRDPGTWVPAGGAVVIAAGGWDDNLSRWAVEHTPVFGSTRAALARSDDLRFASHLGMIATALFVPPGGEPRWRHRFKTLLVEQGGFVVTTSLTGALKSVTGRERPDMSDDLSFPSGHASQAFAYEASASYNLRAGTLPPPVRTGLDVLLKSLAAGTAWARVEGGVHYPSDVLAGAALGNFVSRLVCEAFLPQGPGAGAYIEVGPEAGGGLSVSLRARY